MNQKLLFLLAFFFVNIAKAQVKPANGAVLNYILTGFEVPVHKTAKVYTVEITLDSAESTEDFNRRVYIKSNSNNNRQVIRLPFFDRKYSWRYTCADANNKVTLQSEVYHFNVGTSRYIDTGLYKTMMLQNNYNSDTSLFVFLDNTRTLIDVFGKPVWYLPIKNDWWNEYEQIRDLKMTPQGTITFLGSKNIFEIDYDGNILWKGPNNGTVSGDTSEYYHHEFTRLSNGNYLTLGQYNEYRPLRNKADTSLFGRGMFVNKEGEIYMKYAFGSVIMYDAKGEVVWSKKTGIYFNESDIMGSSKNSRMMGSVHLNAVFFDEKRNMLYLSYRDISKILKVKYPSGELMTTYGNAFGHENKGKTGEGFFYAQHACRVNEQGDLYLFNNNYNAKLPDIKRDDMTSSILVIKQPANEIEDVTKKWEFRCDIDSNAGWNAGGGGSVVEIDQKQYLVCMGSVNRVFVVDKEKKILWNILQFSKQIDETWQPNAGYRASAVFFRDLKRMLIFDKKVNKK